MITHAKSKATLQRKTEPSGLKGSLVYFEDESGPWTSPGVRGWDLLALKAILSHEWPDYSLAARIEEGRQHNARICYVALELKKGDANSGRNGKHNGTAGAASLPWSKV